MPYTAIDGAEERIASRVMDFGGKHYDLEHPAWGLVWDNVADDGPAINDALDWIGTRGGGVVTLPEGTGRIATGLVMRYNYLRLMGRGGRTVFNYDPAGDGSAIKIAAASGPIAYCHVHDMRIITPANALAKTVLEMVDTSQCSVFDTYTSEGNWDSPGGMFLKTRGREFTRIGPNITFAGERFWVMSPNPNSPQIGCDHATIYGPLWLIGRGPVQNAALTARACIEKEPGTPFTSFNTVGVVSVNRFSQLYNHRSTDGVTTDVGYSANLNFVGWRREQSANTVGNELYTIDINGTGGVGALVRGFVADNLHLGGATVTGPAKGIRLAGVVGGSMRNVYYEGETTALELGGACDDISWQEFFTNQAAATLTNSGSLIERETAWASTSGGGMPVRGHYIAPASVSGDNTSAELQKPPSEDGVFGWRRKITDLAEAGKFRLPAAAMGTRKVMLMQIVLWKADGTTYYGQYLFGNTGGGSLVRVLTGSDAAFVTGAPGAGQFGVSIAGVSRTEMENKIGETVNGFYEFRFIL